MSQDDVGPLFESAHAAYDANDWAELERIARKIIEIARRTADERVEARALQNLGLALFNSGSAGQAQPAYEQSLHLFRKLGDRFSAAVVQMNLASIALDVRSDPVQARTLYESALPDLRESGNVARIAQALGNLAEVARLDGEYAQALRCAREALQLFTELEDTNRVGWQHTTIAHVEALQRHYREATAELDAAFNALYQAQNPRWLATYFEVWLMLAVQLKHWDIAARLMGFLERYRSENKVPRFEGHVRWYSVSVEQIVRHISEDRLLELRRQGAEMNVDDAQEITKAIRTPR